MNKIKDSIQVPLAIKQFLQNQMASFACSAHDEAHCYRVATLSYTIANTIPNSNPINAFYAGLLHDVMDTKLLDSKNSNQIEVKLKEILSNETELFNVESVDVIISVVKSVGFKNLIKENWDTSSKPLEYLCVQDADLLDAIGAIGIARTFAYTGRKNRPMFTVHSEVLSANNVMHEDYMNAQSSNDESTIDHFFRKLLRIPSLMLTERGKQMAMSRQQMMISYLRELDNELIQSGERDHDIDSITKNLLPFEIAKPHSS